MKDIFSRIFPASLWTRRFTYWWVVAFATMLCFDLLWMGQTTFRPFSHLPFWPFFFLGITLLTLPTILFRRSWLQVVVLFIADGVCLANLVYCNTYFNAIPARSYLLAGNVLDFTDSITETFRWYYWALPLITFVSIFLERRFVKVEQPRPRRIPYIITVLVLAVLAWASDAWRGGTMKCMTAIKSNCYKATCVAPMYTIAGFVVHDLLITPDKITPEQEDDVARWLRDQEAYTAVADSVQNKVPLRKNLVIVLCESLESWPIELTVEGVELTPNLNSYIADSTTFFAPKVVSQADAGRSIEGQLLNLAGLLPMRSTVFAYHSPEHRFMTLPKAMHEQGGRSYLLNVDKPLTWNQRGVARAFGFDSLLYHTAWDNVEPVGVARRLSDGKFLEQSVGKMQRGEVWPEGENALVMLVTYSGHAPFKLPRTIEHVEFQGDYTPDLANYMSMVHYSDSTLPTLIDYLKSRPDWEETLVVITGDHEGLAKARKAAARWTFVDEGKHVPLVILNAPYPGRFDKVMGQVDIYSTVLDMMGWDTYPWRGMGVSAVNPRAPGVAIDALDFVEGPIDSIPADYLNHLKEARDISDHILRFDLLNSSNNNRDNGN